MISFYKRMTSPLFLHTAYSYYIPPTKQKLPSSITVELVVEKLFQNKQLNQKYILEEIVKKVNSSLPIDYNLKAGNLNGSLQTQANREPSEIAGDVADTLDLTLSRYYTIFNAKKENKQPHHSSEPSNNRSAENVSSKIENEPSPSRSSSFWGSFSDDD